MQAGIIYLFNQQMLSDKACLSLFLLLFTTHAVFTDVSFYSTDTNKGASSTYLFSFTSSLSLLNPEILITFPIQYSLSDFAASIQCFNLQDGVHDQYSEESCWVEPDSTTFNSLYLLGSVVVGLEKIESGSGSHLLVKNVQNPSSASVLISSYFQICIRKNGVLLQCKKDFTRAKFTTPAVISPLGISIIGDPSPLFVNRGTTYILNMKLTSLIDSYPGESLKVRVKLPDSFLSDDPLCSIVSYNSLGQMEKYQQVFTDILPATPNQIDCGPISTLSSSLGLNRELTLKIENLINPSSSSTLTDISVQIVRSLHQQPIQTVTFPATSITIQPQTIRVSIKQSNHMIESTNLYYFYLNFETDLNEHSEIDIEFLSDAWALHSVHLLFGFNSPQGMGYEVLGNKVRVYGFGGADHKIQHIIGLNLTSLDVAGTYPVSLTTNEGGNMIGTWSGTVSLNSTIGSFNILHFSAVQSATKLPVDSTGPLQMNFFLNYELPPSDDIQNGSLEISIFPQIPEPDPEINGVVKCYWKGTLEAADCSYDNSDPAKTVITLISPPHHAYKNSEIPVIITTEGGNSTENLGLTIDPLVQRYRFECEFHLYNSSLIPSEVFYTTWIADAIEMTSCTAISLSHEAEEWTHIQLNLTTPLLDSSLPKQFRVMVQFLGDGWSEYLGYSGDRIYQRFPCVAVGLVGDNINCDLYTYEDRYTPYSNMHINYEFTGPYFLIYGFDQNVPQGVPIRIELPKVKINNAVGIDAKLGVSILEETPGEKEPYVELYFQELTVFTTLPPISLTESAVPSSQASPIEIQTLNQYDISWTIADPSNVAYIMYQITPEELPSIQNTDAACSSALPCTGFGHPANWIVETVTPTAISSPHAFQTLLDYIRAMDYLPDVETYLPIKMTTYDGSGNTIQKYSMDIHYIAKPIPTASFDFLEAPELIYSGLEQWYSVSFANTNSTLSEYPFIRFILADGLSFADPAQCNSSTVLPYNESGIICVREDPQTMLVYNIQTLPPLGTYSMWMRMETTLAEPTGPINPTIDIHINHNYSVDSSVVSEFDNLPLTENPVTPALASPQHFQVHNPQVLNEDIQLGYIGPLYLQFSSSAAGQYNIDIQLSDHQYNGGGWKTPNSDDLDPVVCMLNQIRYDCIPANGPLKLSMTSVDVLSGLNEMRLDTENIDPFNGIKFPDVPGLYLLTLTLTNTLSPSQISSVSFYAEIHAPKFLHMQAGSIVKDINTESVYMVNFTLPAWHIYPNSNMDAANYSKITIEFPTLEGSLSVFQDDLGGYEGEMHERVGCYFKNGANFVTFADPEGLRCRLVPSQLPGDPVRVEIINHAAFSAAQNSLSVYIFKVYNPQIQHSSVIITAKIEHIEVGTGHSYPLFQQRYRMFLDPRAENISPTIYPSADPSSVQFFQSGMDVGDYGSIALNAHTVSGNPINDPYFMLVKLPPYLIPDETAAPAYTLCPDSSFQECITVPQIGYLMVKGIFNTSQFKVNLKDLPISISLDDSYFYSNVIEEGRFTGIIEYEISAQFRWQELQGTLVLNYCQAAGLQEKVVKSREYFDLEISITNTNFIPSKGTIEIGFPPSVTNVQPHCRSAVAAGSGLVVQAGTSGEIGCMVQNTNKWVITGFTEVLPGTTIIITGQLNLPAVSGSIGMGHITTYADTHLSDIHSNGSRIDHLETDFNLVLLDTLAMNPNEDVFMTQRGPVRTGYVGELRAILQHTAPISPTDSITLRLAMKDMKANASNVGGFSLSSRLLVCEFIRMDTNEQKGCKVTSSIDVSILNHESVVYLFKPTENLLSNTKYEIRLTTQSYSQPALPEGIPYPTIPGKYKVELITTVSSATKVQHMYLEVYGTSFQELSITQYNYLAAEYNLIWVELVPTTPILTTHQIIVEFPTLSSDGVTTMFENDLGLQDIADGASVPVDIFDSGLLDNDYMQCRLYHGDQSRGVPVKVVCGGLLSDLLSPNYLRFALGLMNPPRITPTNIPSQISLPIIVYSYDPFMFQKTNFNLVNAAVLAYNGDDRLAPNVQITTASYQLQMPDDDLLLGDAHTFPLLPLDSYVIRFNFPIRVNGLFPAYCLFNNGAITGDAYYHERLRAIVCKVISGTVPAQNAPLTTTLTVQGFYTPWYRLAQSELEVSAIATYHSTSTSEVINYFSDFPWLHPRWQFNTMSTLQITYDIGHGVACQTDDYIFTIRLEDPSSTEIDLQYCDMISISLPLTTIVDYHALNTDCVEHITSEIEVVLCQVDINARIIYIEIVPGIYTNGKTIAIKTKDHALRNPCTFWNTALITEFEVFFYSWENVTASGARSLDYAYMTINTSNMNPFPLTYQQQSYTLSTHFSFDWIHTPHERYYNQFPQYTINQYSPFSFDVWLTTAVTAASFNKMSLSYGSDFVKRDAAWTLDLEWDKPVCFLHNNRIQRCYLDTANQKIWMEFDFALPPNKPIHVYFSILDPRNPEKNGFKYIGSSDINKVRVDLIANGITHVFETDPFMAKETHVGGTGDVLPQRGIINATADWATNIINNFNVIDMTFTVNRTDITALQFSIPLVNEINQPLYNTNDATAFFDISDGGEYPCGNNLAGDTGTGSPKCFIYNGLNENMGFPTVITMTDFKYTGSIIKARLILMNPDIVDKWFSIRVKAFSGTHSSNSVFGHQYVGYWNFFNMFRTQVGTAVGSFYSNSGYMVPNKGVWRELTSWTIAGSSPQGRTMAGLLDGQGGYIVVQVPINNNFIPEADTEREYCETDFNIGDTSSDDLLILKSKQTQKVRGYFIKKWDLGATTWLINYFKCKHYSNRFIIHYFPSQAVCEKDTIYFPPHSYSTTTLLQSTITAYENINTRFLIELNYDTVMATIISQGFIWDDNIQYTLSLSMTGVTEWSTINSCYVTAGFLNTKGNMPTCTVFSSSGVRIQNFQQLVQHDTYGHRIKVQLEVTKTVNPLLNPGVSVTSTLWANAGAFPNWNWVFQTSTSNAYPRSINYYTPQYNGIYCYGYPVDTWILTQYSTVTVANNINIIIDQFGYDGIQTSIDGMAKLSMKFRIYSTTVRNFLSNIRNYPKFYFNIEGYDPQILSYNSFTIAYVNELGTRAPYNVLSYTTCCASGSSFEVNFNSIGNVDANWASSNPMGANEYFEIDVVFNTASNEEPYLRDWIGLNAFINRRSQGTCTSNIWCYCLGCVTNYIQCPLLQDSWASGETIYNNVKLANSFTLEALSTNVGLPTEMSMTFIQIYPEIGEANRGKLLLIEFNSATQPFSYINGTTANVKIECQCVTSWSTVFTNSATVAIDCWLRKTQGSFSNYAITLNVDVSVSQSLKCYFPEWVISSGTLQATAKIINEGSSYPPDATNVNTYGGLQRITSNSLTFSANPATTALTLSESPALFTTVQQVNTEHSSAYSLTLTLSSGTISNPIVYMDFQKSGFIPDQSFCSASSVFSYCRVYNTYRNIIVAQFITATPSTTFTFSRTTSNLKYPKHKEPGTNYDIIARMRTSGINTYTYEGTLTRSDAMLIPTIVQLFAQPDVSTSTNIQTYRSNVILTFKLDNHIIFPYYTNKAHISVTEDAGLLSAALKSCTAIVTDSFSPAFFLDCYVKSGTIIVRNLDYTRSLSASGEIQIIVGVTNPSVSSVTWTLKAFQYYVDINNYGQQIETTTTYSIRVEAGTEQARSQIRMLHFNTKVYTTDHTPFRIAFKLSDSPPSLPDSLDFSTPYNMVLTNFDSFSSPDVFTHFECLFKEYTLEPTEASQTPFLNPYRNWKQETQYTPLYAYCTKTASDQLVIEMPRIKPLSINNYYELVVMPTGPVLPQTGFSNVADSEYRLISIPDSCEYIGDWKYYSGHMFALNSIYLVSERPQVDTALQLHFTLNFVSSLVYPDHYLEVHFRDLNLQAIKAPYNVEGKKVPCTLSSQFVTAGRTHNPACVINYVHAEHGDLVLRVVEIGALPASNSYKLSLDDFMLPDLTTLLEPSNPFTICLRFVTESTTIHYERCFGELFVMDGEIFVDPVTVAPGSFVLPTITSYGAGVTGTLTFSYPETSTQQVDQKAMARISGGYSATTPSPLSFGSHTILWHNPEIDLYILKQPLQTQANSHTISMSGLINPEPYQKQQYEYINTLDITYYDDYHPHTEINYNQPPYTHFTKNTPLVKLDSTYLHDIRSLVPDSTPIVVKLAVKIQETVAELTRKLNDKFEVQFTSGVLSLEECWVATAISQIWYEDKGACQTTADNKILLYNFYSSNVNNNLTVYVRLKQTTQAIAYTSRLYSDNGELQYEKTYTQTITKINPSLDPYPLISFTENFYTTYYYEQAIVPLTISTVAKYLYFNLFLPKDMTHELTLFHISLPTTIVPKDTLEIKNRCEWLRADRYSRQYHTGVYSHCEFAGGILTVTGPFGGLPSTDSNGRIPYLLKIREMDVINTEYLMPLNSKQEEIILGFNDSNIFQKDSLIIYPYQHFPLLDLSHLTLDVNELNTYKVEFTPSLSVSPGIEAVLQLSLDNRYMVKDLGIDDLLKDIGVNYDNQTRIDNLNYNLKYDIISDKWINGAGYTCWTSTASLPNQTTIHTGNGANSKTIRVTHLLETAYAAGAKYIWAVPLLLNPAALNLPFRMNLTLWTYQAGSTLAQKELFYEIINEKFTTTYDPSSFAYTLTTQNQIQSTAADPSITISSLASVPLLNQYISLKMNNQLTGVIDFPVPVPDPSYNFYFFPRVNLFTGMKLVSDFSLNVVFSPLSTTNEYADYYGYDWVKIYGVGEETIRAAGSQSMVLDHCLITNIDAFIELEGLVEVKDSQFLLKFGFTNSNCWIPKNSTLIIDYDSSVYQPLIDSPCYISFREHACTHHTGRLQVSFNEPIPLSTAIVGHIYLRAVGLFNTTTNFTAFIYGIPGEEFTKVIEIPLMDSLTITEDNVLEEPLFEHIQVTYIYEDSQADIRGTVVTNKPFTYIDMTHPFTSSLLSLQRMLIRQNSTSPYLYDPEADLNWIQTIQTVVTNDQTIEDIPPNGLLTYDILAPHEYTFIMESTYDTSGDLNNFTVGKVGSYYQFQYLTENEIAYDEVYPYPVAEHLVILNPLTEVGQETALGFQFFVTNYSIVPGNRITLQLDTHNLRYDMFRETSNYEIECVERVKFMLTYEPALTCEVTQRPTPTNPNQALIITIYPKLTVAANTPLEIWISPVFNPDIVMVAGATLRVDVDCNGEQRCVIYESRGYYRTTTGINFFPNLIGTFTPSLTDVLLQNIDHTFDINSDTYEAMFFRYPQNYETIMPLECAQAGGDSCLIFPKQKRVLTLLSSVTTSSITLTGMNNGIHLQPASQFIDVVAITANSANLYQILHNNLTTRKIVPPTNAATWMTITPTQTPAVFLRNYMNTATIQIYGLYSTTFVDAFYINAPTEIVTWDDTYCNATFESLNHDPYPTRLLCKHINDTTLQILIPEGVEENYLDNITSEFIMTVHAKFFVQDFPPGDGILYVSPPVVSGTFNAYGSYSTDNHSYPYYITEASTDILISEHRVPILGDAHFNTESYTERLANIDEQTNFQLIIDPKTTDTITRMEIVLPEEFGYPPIGQHDACELISHESTFIDGCYEIRRNNKTILSLIMKEPYTYDNGPSILKLGSEDISDWFTAPSIPGSWYNLSVLLYGENDVLLEQQTTENCSNIGGLDLHMPSITISNGRDANQNEIFDISFVVGTSSIRQGYEEGLSAGEFYTEIRIYFENTDGYDRGLGLNRLEGELTGCASRGITKNRQLSCYLHVGLNINDEPYISVQGYEPIMPNTNVTISFSSILNLPSTFHQTVSISVLIKQVGSWKEAYLYNPTKKVSRIVSDLATVPPTSASVIYNAPRVVNLPTNINFTITPTVDILVGDYFALKFPEDAFNNEYTLFNPSCAQCSHVDVFYRNEVARIYPSTVHLAGTSVSYSLNNFPSPQYSFSVQPYNVTIEAYRDLKQVNTLIYTIPTLEIATCSFPFGIMSTTSPYTYDSGVTYTFDFEVPTTSSQTSNEITVAVEFPPQYGDLRQTNMTCEILNSTSTTCSVSRASHIEIRGIRDEDPPKLKYKLLVRNIVNPSTLLNNFIITSFEGENIEHIICQGDDDLQLLKSSTETCLFEVENEQYSTKYPSLYKFEITCPNVLRNDSELYVSIPPAYVHNNLNSVPCWGEPRTSLLTTACPIEYINGSFYLHATQLNTNKDQNTFSLWAELNNPIIDKNYNFSASLSINNFTYGSTGKDSVTIYNSSNISKINSVELLNMPQQSGVEGYYFLRVPTANIGEETQITFPKEFEIDGRQLEVMKFMSNSSTFASDLGYAEILSLQSQGVSLDVDVSEVNMLNEKVRIYDSDESNGQNGTWTYFMFKNIVNPSYQSQQNFTINSYSYINEQHRILNSTTELPLRYDLSPPASDAHHIGATVSDNDLLFLTDYTLTYRLDSPLITNSSTIYIRPPSSQTIYALKSLNCCLAVNSSYTYCAQCQIYDEKLQLVVPDGVSIAADTNFSLVLKNLYNPGNESDCSIFAHYKQSYFGLEIIKSDTMLTHSSSPPTTYSVEHSPCIKYRRFREDILPTFPDVVYAGLVYNFTISLSAPTKMLRVQLECTDSAVSFSPFKIYFNDYNVLTISGQMIISSMAANNSNAYINVTHSQSLAFDVFRPNLPLPLKILTGFSGIVEVQQTSAESIGYDIYIPIQISPPASSDLYIELTLTNSDSPLFESSQLVIPRQIFIPAFSSHLPHSFIFKYLGTKIPETLNISMSLKSEYPLTHSLIPPYIYLYFKTSPTHNTLPSLMAVDVLHQYRRNSLYAGRQVYNVEQENAYLFYDQLRPIITKHEDYMVGSTSAQVIVHTREESTVAYVVRKWGDHLTMKPSSPSELRAAADSIHLDTFKNASFLVNPYTWLNLTSLEQQTTYYIYMMAYSSLGNSTEITTHILKTPTLSNAATFKLITDQVLTDEVDIVLSLSKILMIDPTRIKVVSSEKLINETYDANGNVINRNHLNKPTYEHQIVVSPSVSNDTLPAMELVQEKLFNSEFGQMLLKEMIPSWVGYFQTAELKLINRVKPTLRRAPESVKISYYNATFKTEYWAGQRVHAILLEQLSKTQDSLSYTRAKITGKKVTPSHQYPISTQISQGLDQHNSKADDYFTTVCGDKGEATIFFKGLRPGSRYKMYVTATSPEIYQPVIFADDNQVTETVFYTLWNPNLRNKQKLIMNELKDMRPQLFEAIDEFYKNSEIKSKHSYARQ